MLLREADRAHLAHDYPHAVVLYRQVLEQDGPSFQAWHGLAAASASMLEHGDAVAAFHEALRLNPVDAKLRVGLARSLFALGRVSEAVANYRQAAGSTDAEARAMAIRTIACIAPGDPALDNAAVLAARREWAAAERRLVRPHNARPAPGEKLRVGYYGSFFASQNWMKMYIGLVNAHDRDRFEVNLIVDGADPSPEAGYCDHDLDRVWDVTGVSNADLADLIVAAGIDILVDLNGYSHQLRVPLPLYRAAPVQMAWQGMYATTGFDEIDLLIADHTALPAEEERFYSERIHRVSHSYLPFQMFYETPNVTPPPSLANGFITFGSLISAYKLTDLTLDAWARILHAVPGSRLLLRNAGLAQPSVRADMLSRLQALGIVADRVTLLGRADHFAFLATYDQIDIALDAFPYSGGTTTAEALWQGVPLLTTAGDRWAGRTSASLLNAAGLGEFVARDVPALVDLAVSVANSPLAERRAGQRARIAASPACDVPGLCRQMEALYLSETARVRATVPSMPAR